VSIASPNWKPATPPAIEIEVGWEVDINADIRECLLQSA